MKTHFVEYRNGYRIFLNADEIGAIFKHKRKPIYCGAIVHSKRRGRLRWYAKTMLVRLKPND